MGGLVGGWVSGGMVGDNENKISQIKLRNKLSRVGGWLVGESKNKANSAQLELELC